MLVISCRPTVTSFQAQPTTNTSHLIINVTKFCLVSMYISININYHKHLSNHSFVTSSY